MYTEDDLLPISALQHLSFCERQCCLIHLEQSWAENRLTAEGRVLHNHSTLPESESRDNVHISRDLRLRSYDLGLTGIADVVEFHMVSDAEGRSSPGATRLAGVDGFWRIFPVEYKRGKPKLERCDEVQLCAQAICLEEMLKVTVSEGALFYGQPRRRTHVEISPELRLETQRLASRLHELLQTGHTPAAVYKRRCRGCSLLEICRPKATASFTASSRYLANQLDDLRAQAENSEPEP